MTQGLDYAKVATRLRAEHLVDMTGMLRSGGRAEVISAIGSWEARGLHAYVLVAAFQPTGAIRDAWTALAANPKLDLLLFFNGTEWEAHGWGLEAARIRSALTSAEPALREYHGKGLARALDRLGEAAVFGGSAAANEHAKAGTSAVGLTGVGVAAVLAASGLGFILHRRSKVAKEARAGFDEARASGERAYAELMLAAEDLDSKDAQELQLKAAGIKTRFDALIEGAAGNRDKMSDPVTLGKIRQLESEMAALRSTALQLERARRTDHAEVEDRGESAERRDEADDGSDRVDEVSPRGTNRSS